METKLLIEIGIEELPAIPLLKELPNISAKWSKILDEYGLKSDFSFFYTPRRLVLYHTKFLQKQKNHKAEFIGAPRDVAFKDGKLSQAGLSFLKKTGLSEAELCFKEIKGKEVLYYEKEIQGKESKELLEEMIKKFISCLNFGKSMRWKDNSFEFIRPIRSLAVLLGDDLVDMSIYGVKSAKTSFVHRSVSYEAFAFGDCDEYFKILQENFVILNQDERRKKILDDFKKLEEKYKIKIKEDSELLDEVVAITEYPSALIGNFEKEFLSLPSEVIINSMRENQRYFSVFKDGAFHNSFVVVSNAVCDDYNFIINGNERVLRARLSDAMFFYENDLKNKLQVQNLKKISYFEGLGTMYDKVQREKNLAKELCQIYKECKLDDVLSAVEYSKADLSTQMVYEFTDLQGIMGYHYAKKEGFKDEICLAILEQYLPKSENDILPSTQFSSIVALANKFDTLLSLFSINKIPSGTKDPYALRRAAIGVLKIIINSNINFKLDEFLQKVAPNYKNFDTKTLLTFILERLYSLHDANASFIKAALNSKSTDIVHLNSSIKALIKLSKDENFSSYFDTFKRLANIIKNENTQLNIDENLLLEKEEKDLFSSFKKCKLDNSPYELLKELFELKEPIDKFFDNVMINVDDEKIKKNRQALIFNIYKSFLTVADIKEISLWKKYLLF